MNTYVLRARHGRGSQGLALIRAGVAVIALLCALRTADPTFADGGCPGELPMGMYVAGELRHENGTGPTDYLTAGLASGAQREIVHANRYTNGGGMMVTHICINARQPDDRFGAPPAQPVIVFIATSDDVRPGDPNGELRPGSTVWSVTETIQGGYQLIDVNPPVAAGAILWVGARFPTAIPSNGHMGVGTATVQDVMQSFVAIINFAGGQDLWRDYEGIQAQGWGYYNGKRPILRALDLRTATGPCNVVVNSFTGNTTSEPGGSVGFSVGLTRPPAQNRNVVVNLQSSDPTEGDISPPSLTFTPLDWNVLQTVTVTGVDDNAIDGDIPYTVGGTAYSQDPCFHLVSVPGVNLINLDNDNNPGCPRTDQWDLAANTGPAPRYWPAMAYDSARGVTVMFGGTDGSSTLFDDTWEWDGTAWQQLVNTNGPPGRYGHAMGMAYDPVLLRTVVVMYGGSGFFSTQFNDTWVWDGVTWSQRFVPGPGYLTYHTLAYQANRGVTVLYGGVDDSGNASDETWEWDGNAWFQRSSLPNNPGPRHFHAMTYDSASGNVLLSAGFRTAFPGPPFPDDLWEFDGSDWTLVIPQTPAPSGRYSHGLVYDDSRGVTILFGGEDGPSCTVLTDTWEWDNVGRTWQQLYVSAPPPRYDFAMAFDQARGVGVLFGGYAPQLSNQIWTYRAEQPFGFSRTFCVSGSPTGAAWSWSITSPLFNLQNLSTPGVPPSGTAADLVQRFVDSVNSAGCPGVAASVSPSPPQCFEVAIRDTQPFDLCVGPIAQPPNCCVGAPGSCTFNPTISELVLTGTDCNGNGQDDGMDIAGGTSQDCQATGIPDECDIAGGFSADVNLNGIPDECEVPAATVTSAVSRKSNPNPSTGGFCDTNLLPPRKSEPHQGGITEVRIGFNVPPGAPSGSGVIIEQATCAAPPFVPYSGASTFTTGVAGTELVMNFTPGLENARTYRLLLGPPVTSTAGQVVEVRGLFGDATGNGRVDAADRSAVVGAWTGGGFSCPTDVTGNGSTDAGDRSAIVGAWTGAQNCAP